MFQHFHAVSFRLHDEMPEKRTREGARGEIIIDFPSPVCMVKRKRE
jgi:hypothetical protein